MVTTPHRSRARASGARPFLSLASGSLSPLLLTCEHATNRLPFRARFGARVREILDSHWGWDIGAWELTREVSRLLTATAIGGRWSRLWIDLNRRVDDETLIRRVAGGVPLPWNARIGPQEIERRMVACHGPYHLELDRMILRRATRGVRPLLFSLHTFTPELDGQARPFDAGVLFDEHEPLARRLAADLRGAGLSVRYNEPYSGKAGLMYSAQRHATHHGLACLEIELNQGLFARRGAARRLGVALAGGLRGLGQA